MNKMFEYLTDQPILRWVFGGIGCMLIFNPLMFTFGYVYLLFFLTAFLRGIWPAG